MNAYPQRDTAASSPVGIATDWRRAAPRLVLTAGLLLGCSACIVVPARTPEPVVAAAPSVPNCREYSQPVTIGGQTRQAFGTTCQQADGSWRLSGTDAPRPARGTIVHPVAPYPRDPYYPRGPYIVVPVGPATDDSVDHSK